MTCHLIFSHSTATYINLNLSQSTNKHLTGHKGFSHYGNMFFIIVCMSVVFMVLLLLLLKNNPFKVVLYFEFIHFNFNANSICQIFIIK